MENAACWEYWSATLHHLGTYMPEKPHELKYWPDIHTTPVGNTGLVHHTSWEYWPGTPHQLGILAWYTIPAGNTGLRPGPLVILAWYTTPAGNISLICHSGVCAILLRLYTSAERLKRLYTSPGSLLEICYLKEVIVLIIIYNFNVNSFSLKFT